MVNPSRTTLMDEAEAATTAGGKAFDSTEALTLVEALTSDEALGTAGSLAGTELLRLGFAATATSLITAPASTSDAKLVIGAFFTIEHL
jgi:hypothetical protein